MAVRRSSVHSNVESEINEEIVELRNKLTSEHTRALRQSWARLRGHTGLKKVTELLYRVFERVIDRKMRATVCMENAFGSKTAISIIQTHAEFMAKLLDYLVDPSNKTNDYPIDKFSFYYIGRCHANMDRARFSGERFEMFGQAMSEAVVSPACVRYVPHATKAWTLLFAIITDSLHSAYDQARKEARLLGSPRNAPCSSDSSPEERVVSVNPVGRPRLHTWTPINNEPSAELLSTPIVANQARRHTWSKASERSPSHSRPPSTERERRRSSVMYVRSASTSPHHNPTIYHHRNSYHETGYNTPTLKFTDEFDQESPQPQQSPVWKDWWQHDMRAATSESHINLEYKPVPEYTEPVSYLFVPQEGDRRRSLPATPRNTKQRQHRGLELTKSVPSVGSDSEGSTVEKCLTEWRKTGYIAQTLSEGDFVEAGFVDRHTQTNHLGPCACRHETGCVYGDFY